MLDSKSGSFTTMDPLAEKYYSWSPYAYCMGNPVRNVDPTGMASSPYYNSDGDFLGVDQKGFTGERYITTQETFEANSTNGVADSKKIQADENTQMIKEVNLSKKAEANIYTDVFSKMEDISIDNLYNSEVSILNKTVINQQ